ncbi:MAG: hypothetical protein ACTSWM_03970 [Alphaproteobacteria bacterium]
MSDDPIASADEPNRLKPTPAQQAWLRRGLDQPGGKLPLFDENGRRVPITTIRRCLEAGWAEPLFSNPIKPDWLVCKITEAGRELASGNDAGQPGPNWPSNVHKIK